VIVPPQRRRRIEDGKMWSLKELVEIFENGVDAPQHGKIQAYNLEKVLCRYERAVDPG
jgi:hypothetical protein